MVLPCFVCRLKSSERLRVCSASQNRRFRTLILEIADFGIFRNRHRSETHPKSSIFHDFWNRHIFSSILDHVYESSILVDISCQKQFISVLLVESISNNLILYLFIIMSINIPRDTTMNIIFPTLLDIISVGEFLSIHLFLLGVDTTKKSWQQ